MSSISQSTDNGDSISDFATKFMKKFHIGRLLFRCNAGKEKGIPVMNIFKYLFSMMFSDRSIYMQMKTGTYKGTFSKNTIYCFLNDVRINWQSFTTLLSADIICRFTRRQHATLPIGFPPPNKSWDNGEFFTCISLTSFFPPFAQGGI